MKKKSIKVDHSGQSEFIHKYMVWLRHEQGKGKDDLWIYITYYPQSILTYGNLSFRNNFELEKAPCLCVWTGKKRNVFDFFKHCCVSLTFWYGSGSADLYRWLMDPDSFRQWPSRCQQKLSFLRFFAYYVFKVHLHQSSKIKSHKEVANSRNQGFLTYCAW